MSANHNLYDADFSKPEVSPVVFCPATRLYAPRPHRMPADEAHIYFKEDSPECRECSRFMSCNARIKEAGFLEIAAQSV